MLPVRFAIHPVRAQETRLARDQILHSPQVRTTGDAETKSALVLSDAVPIEFFPEQN